MKSRFFTLLLCLLAAVAFTGCNLFGSSSSDGPGTTYGNLRIKVVSSADTNTVVDATVQTSNGDFSTRDGDFHVLNSVAIDNNGKVRLTITPTGAFIGLETFEAVASNQTTHAEYKLNPLPPGNVKSNVDFTTAQTLDVSTSIGSATIAFSAGSVKNGDNIVTDTDVTIAYVEPISETALDSFPGSFMGVRTDNSTTAFVTYGFIYVNLGEGNQLVSPATITMNIPAAKRATAPDTMPFWNYENGVWTEVGTAEKIGDNYVVSVNHFSWYNLDAPIEVSRLDVIVASQTSEISDTEWAHHDNSFDKNDLSIRVAGARVLVVASNEEQGTEEMGTWRSDSPVWQEAKITDSTGKASFNIPTNRRFSIKVKTADKEVEAYSYEVVGGVATAFVNMSGFQYR